MNTEKYSIAFWGTPPPPIGGMNVHIERISFFLGRKGWNYVYYDFSKVKSNEKNRFEIKNLFFWYLTLWFSKSPKIHYIITTRPFVRFLASLLTLRRKIIILRVGGESLKKGIEEGFIASALSKMSLKLCTSVIGVNQSICDLASRYTKSEKVYCIPGFIPPVDKGQKAPQEVIEFFKKSKLKIVVTGQIVSKHKNDIYGLWHIIDTFKLVKENVGILDVKCCVVSYSIEGNNIKDVENFESEIKKFELDDMIKVYQSKGDLWPIFKESNLFIRSSTEDGDANSLREAHFFKNRIIASDCVKRPSYSILYKTSDHEDLYLKIKNNIDLSLINIETNIISNAELIEKMLIEISN